MPFSVAVAGSSVQIVATDGTITNVTLPTGVYIATTADPPSIAILDRYVVIANSPTKPIWIDPDGVCRPLPIPIPKQAPTCAAGAAGGLTGTFRVKVSYLIKDNLGNDLAEGPMSVASLPVAVVAQFISMTNIPISPEPAVNARRLYRTATGPGTEYFEWFDIEDNLTTTATDDASDAALSLLPAPDDLGTCPARLSLVVEWKGRLWGVASSEVDSLRFTADGKIYAWPAENTLLVRPVGRDRFGITGFLPRRDELGVGRRDYLWKVIGNDETDYRMVKLVEGKGIYGPRSVVVTRDVARWLADDGVYAWDASGVKCISDDDVKGWFTTDSYFNRSRFPYSVGRYNPIRHAYDLFLAPAGDTALTRWVSYDIDRNKWLGPHKTDEFTPAAAGLVFDSNELQVPCVGSSSGYLYLVTPGTYRDGASTAIDFDTYGAFHTGGAPDIEHFWGLFSILQKEQAAGTLAIYITTGELDSSNAVVINHDMTRERAKLRRGGVGRLMQVRFKNAEVNRECEIYGYELPFHELGRR
jgi:hypothetical protein